MKKIISLILVLVLIMSVSACGKVEITMQEIYDAGQTEALLKNHQSVYIRDEMDGEFLGEKYLTKEYVYDYVYGEELDWVEFVTDDAGYYYINGDYLRFWSITPDGINDDFTSYRAKRYGSAVLGADTINETIESVSKKDSRITVTSVFNQEILENMAEDGVTSGKLEYALDAKTYEVISIIGDYTFDDGTALHVVTEATYDAEAPERVKTFLEYANQKENLRNIMVVSNAGTEKEVSQSVQAPKGLIIVFRYDEDSAYEFEIYTDAACTELYDPYEDTDSDLTIYVKWTE